MSDYHLWTHWISRHLNTVSMKLFNIHEWESCSPVWHCCLGVGPSLFLHIIWLFPWYCHRMPGRFANALIIGPAEWTAVQAHSRWTRMFRIILFDARFCRIVAECLSSVCEEGTVPIALKDLWLSETSCLSDLCSTSLETSVLRTRN